MAFSVPVKFQNSHPNLLNSSLLRNSQLQHLFLPLFWVN